MNAIGIAYAFGEWGDEIHYPYSVGELPSPEEIIAEDGSEETTMLLTGFQRGGSYLGLESAKEAVKTHFDPIYGKRGETADGGAWTGAIIGATNGGGKVSIEGEYLDIELDGALVLVKGLTVKQGGKASMEVNVAELSGDSIKMATNFKEGETDAEGYSMYVDKPDIAEGDYIENFGFVGKTANGEKDIIIIFENALCKSAFELEAKNKEQAVLKLTLEAYADNAGDLDTLPVKIYYPTAASA